MVKIKFKPVTEEELEPYIDLFNEAYKKLENKEQKIIVMKELKHGLEKAGLDESKITNAIVLKLSYPNPATGTAYAAESYIRKQLAYDSEGYHATGKNKPRTTETAEKKFNDEQRRKRAIAEEILDEFAKAKELGVEVEGTEFEITDSQGSTAIVESAVSITDNSNKEKEKEKEQALLQDIERLEKKLEENDERCSRLAKDRDTAVDRYEVLLKEYNKLKDELARISKPFLERLWVGAKNADGSISGVEIDPVADPVKRRIQIPANSDDGKISYTKSIDWKDKDEHENDWIEKTKGKRSADVVYKKPKPTNKSQQSE